LRDILVSELRRTPLEEQRVEICERKGLGHPDYICDAVMNEVSIGLSRDYLKKFGKVLHHNTDKSLLVAGEAENRFGGGVVKKPMLLVFGDRATFEVGNERVPVEEIAVKAAKDWIRKNLRFVDPEKHIRYQVELKQGSAELTDIFQREGEFLGANDTSAAVGFAPMTETEKIVLETERFLNSREFKKSHPESGEDIKVMVLRKDSELQLTIAMAFVDRFIDSESRYFSRKNEILEEVNSFVASKVQGKKVQIDINTLDKRSRGMGGIYLTVTGTSADSADCGQVGRGNRVNGLIPLNRPTSSEAAAGKNPVSHIGKIYNLLSYRMADRIYVEVPGIREAYVWLLSQIGQPIDQPKITAAQLVLRPGTRIRDISKSVDEILASELDEIGQFTKELAEGKIPVC